MALVALMTALLLAACSTTPGKVELRHECPTPPGRLTEARARPPYPAGDKIEPEEMLNYGVVVILWAVEEARRRQELAAWGRAQCQWAPALPEGGNSSSVR